MNMIDQIRPLRDELILKRCNSPIDRYENGESKIQLKREKNDEVLWFEVVKVGYKAKENISPGDKVLVPLGRYTPPLKIDGVEMVSTSEQEVLVVCPM